MSQQSKLIDINMSIVTYSLSNYEEICKDVATRSKILLDFKTIIERKIRIESQYLCKMKQLGAMPEMRKIPNAIKTTQIVYNSLINAIYSEIDNLNNHVLRMETQINKQLASICFELDSQSKRQIMNASILIRDYDKKYDEIDKLKFKVSKKGAELKKLKQEYIVGTLIDMPFDKKNKLFIRTKQIEESYKPLKQQYDQCVKIFNEKANIISEKLKQIIRRIENCEHEKVELMKKIFMVLQISNSQYGANLIQDKASILSRLNNLETSNPDFKKGDLEAFQVFKNQMLVQQHDPCSYINNLFTNIVDTKNMQGLVIYGHQAKHRESISQCMTQLALEETVAIPDKEKTDFALVREIASCFKNIFNEGVEADPEKLKRLKQLMQKSPESRKNFILCLQKFRTLGKFDISIKKLKSIEYILNVFLDQCLNELDTYNSKLLLVLSFTYYVTEGDKKIDLHNYIQNHQIWKDKQWWQCALLESSYQQLKVKPKKMQQPPITIWHIKGSGLKNTENQHELTSQNILFNQLTFYLHNMRLFQIKEEIITFIANKYVKHFQLSPKIAADIQPFLVIQEVSNQELQSELTSPLNGSPISIKKKATRKFFSRNSN